MEQDEKKKWRTMEAANQALRSVPDAVGIVLLVVRAKAGARSHKDMEIQVVSGFRGQELSDEAMRDLLRTASTMETFH